MSRLPTIKSQFWQANDDHGTYVPPHLVRERSVAEVVLALGESSGVRRLMRDESLFICDTGASSHSTFSLVGATNIRRSGCSSFGQAGSATRAENTVDLAGRFVDCNGEIGITAILKDVSYSSRFNFNLLSLTKLLMQDWRIISGDDTSIVVEKGSYQIKFDTIIKTTKGAIYACKFDRRSSEISAANNSVRQTSSDGSKRIKKINIVDLHSKLGHINEADSRTVARQLGMTISRGTLKPCESCALAKAKQKNVSKQSDRPKQTVVGGLLNLDLTKVTVKLVSGGEAKVSCNRWCIITDEASGKKWSIFTLTKSGMVDPACVLFTELTKRGISIRRLRMDPGGENIKLEKKVKSVALAPTLEPLDIEYTSRNTPQHNSRAETSFTTISGRARAMMNQANLPDEVRGKLSIQALTLATLLDGLVPIMINGKLATRDEHVYGSNPNWASKLRIFGEAGVVKEGKNGKSGNRGTTMLFVGYSGREKDGVKMYNPNTNGIVNTRDVIWLKRMFYEPSSAQEQLFDLSDESEAEDDDTQDETSMVEEEEETPTTEVGDEAIPVSSEDEDEEIVDDEGEEPVAGGNDESGATGDGSSTDTPRANNTSTFVSRQTRAGRHTRQPYWMARDESNGVSLSAVEMLQLAQLEKLDNNEVMLSSIVDEEAIELALVGAGTKGDFEHTDQLKVLNFKQAMADPEREKFIAEVEREKKRFDKYKVLKEVQRSELPKNAIVMSSTWAFKRKANGDCRGRLNARGFEQRKGIHYNPDSISSPVTNANTIRIVLTLLAASPGWEAWIVDVEAAFLQGKFYDGEEMYIEVPEGFEQYYPRDAVLQMLRPLYGTKQAAACFNKTLVDKLKELEYNLERSMADPCMYFTRIQGRLVIMLSWIDDLMIVGLGEDVQLIISGLTKALDCKVEGRMMEYVGTAISMTDNEYGTRSIKMTQPVHIQKLTEQYDVPLGGEVSLTPATAGEVLLRGDSSTNGGAMLSVEDAKVFRSATASTLYICQYSRPDILNAVRELTRHMSAPRIAHQKALWRLLRYLDSTENRGWLLEPKFPWDSKQKLVIRARSDSNYASNSDDRRSVTGCVVYLNECPVMARSNTQKHVTLSVTEAEGSAGVTAAQDMLYTYNVVTSMGAEVATPMLLEIDNKGAVFIANSWSVGGRTRHVDVRHHFLRELKERNLIVIKHVPGEDNEADIFTKNVSAKDFERHIRNLVGEDEYMMVGD